MSDGENAWVHALVDVLQRERELLERLRFRFVGLELMLAAREVRFLAWAAQDLNRARIKVREADLVRAAEVGAVGLKCARGGVASLREVAAVASPPWSGILRDHHDSLCGVVAEIELHGHGIAQRCRDGLAELAHTGTLELAAATSALVGSDPAVESDLGGDVSRRRALSAPDQHRAPGQAEDLDPISIECLLSDVSASASRLRIPALLAFLR
ncbi:hypothetical protein [Iamia sp.]|uniref:hypothetical protein n=1 Tax=Iamia sp. TaxID=2722710 RepID=UPI002BE42BD2|nr:hypothetical protein [Iamia sp.]HXH57810.1 hypothetical protein [Iamia sp.]